MTTKNDEFTAALESEIVRHCGNAAPIEILRWLLERQKIYVGRWLGFVSLDKINTRALIENDFFLAIKICLRRIDIQLDEVLVESMAYQYWKEFKRAIDDIEGDLSLFKTELLLPLLSKIVAELEPTGSTPDS
jgi:hypothetical protein